MLAVNPYLAFNGTCEAVFNFYKSVFGGEFDGGFYRYKDIPDGPPIPAEEREKVMHVSLPLTKQMALMGADASEHFGPAVKSGDNISLMLSLESEAEARRIYDALSAGDEIRMPLQKTFWAELYGAFVDRFGIYWSLNYEKK